MQLVNFKCLQKYHFHMSEFAPSLHIFMRHTLKNFRLRVHCALLHDVIFVADDAAIFCLLNHACLANIHAYWTGQLSRNYLFSGVRRGPLAL